MRLPACFAAVAVVLLSLNCATPVFAEGVELPPGFERSNPIPSPEAFSVRGSNGYYISVFPEPYGQKARDRVIVTAADPAGRVSVIAHANLAHEGIRADLGQFGRVAVAWRPSGAVLRGDGRCGKRTFHLWFAGGSYVGSFHFHGDNGFTDAHVRRIAGRNGWWRALGCTYFTSEGFPGPGVLLEASEFSNRLPKGSHRYLSVVQNRPHGRVYYGAGMGEKRGRLEIGRSAYVEGRARTLSFPPRMDTATLTPPPPFSGSATFERTRRGHPGKWLGDLSVDFPGASDVPLAGEDFGATFMRGFRESGVAEWRERSSFNFEHGRFWRPRIWSAHGQKAPHGPARAGDWNGSVSWCARSRCSRVSPGRIPVGGE